MTSSYLLRPLRSKRRAILDRQGGICPLCNESISPYENFEIDHEWATGRGGPDTPDNQRALHKNCHTIKTSTLDVPEIAKTKRLEKKQMAHDEAVAKGERRPNAGERQRRKWQARNDEARTGPERQE